MDSVVLDELGKIDARMYIVDCLPNLVGIADSSVTARFRQVHAGDVGFSVQRRRGHDRAGDFVPDSVCSCRIFAFDCKKSVEQKIVSQLFLHIFLDFSGTRLGYDL